MTAGEVPATDNGRECYMMTVFVGANPVCGRHHGIWPCEHLHSTPARSDATALRAEIARACTTLACENPATVIGTYDDGSERCEDVAYCVECARVLRPEFTPTSGGPTGDGPGDVPVLLHAGEWRIRREDVSTMHSEVRDEIAEWLFYKVTRRDGLTKLQSEHLEPEQIEGWLQWADDLLASIPRLQRALTVEQRVAALAEADEERARVCRDAQKRAKSIGEEDYYDRMAQVGEQSAARLRRALGGGDDG